MGYLLHEKLKKNFFHLMRYYHILHKNNMDLTEFFSPPPKKKVLEKKWTIYLLCFYVHF